MLEDVNHVLHVGSREVDRKALGAELLTEFLVQRFEITGLAVPLLWGPLERGMRQFEELGSDLARRLSAAAPPDAAIIQSVSHLKLRVKWRPV